MGGIREEEEGDRGKQPLTGSDATSRAMRSATSTACREPAHATFIASTSKRAAALSAARWSPSAAAWSMAISAPARIRALAEFRVRRSPNCSSLSPRSIWKSGGRINRDGEAGEARIAMRKTEEEEWRTLLLLRLLLGSFHTQFFFHLIQEYRGRLPGACLTRGSWPRPPALPILPVSTHVRRCVFLFHMCTVVRYFFYRI